MFAFAGASTFPTIQADMRERSKFPISATIAIGSKWDTSSLYYILPSFSLSSLFISVLFLIYFPMAAGCYFAMGNQVGVMLHVTCHD